MMDSLGRKQKLTRLYPVVCKECKPSLDAAEDGV